MEITPTAQRSRLVIRTKQVAFFATVIFASVGMFSTATAQVMPYRAAPPACKGKCGSPLCGPCVADTPYAYVPTRWRRWPVVQASATMAPEELPSPTPAKAPAEAEPNIEDQVPQLPMTPDLPEPTTGPTSTPSTPLAPPFEETPAGPSTGAGPQVPVFGDEPQVPPSAADPLGSPFNDEPPQPPADGDEGLPGSEPTTGVPTPATPSANPAPGEPGTGMPFDVGPPKMPSEDPFQDDPNQTPPQGTKTGARLEQAYRETYGLVRNEATSGASVAPAQPAGTQEPQLLRADGGSLDAARLPAEQAEPNPLRQVSHPGRRTVAIEAVTPPPSKPVGAWRRNPLRGN